MTSLRLAGVLPQPDDDDTPQDPDPDGWQLLADDMVKRPKRLRAALLVFDCCKIVDDTRGTVRPYMGVRRLVPLGDLKDLPEELATAIQQTMLERGHDTLPFDMVG